MVRCASFANGKIYSGLCGHRQMNKCSVNSHNLQATTPSHNNKKILKRKKKQQNYLFYLSIHRHLVCVCRHALFIFQLVKKKEEKMMVKENKSKKRKGQADGLLIIYKTPINNVIFNIQFHLGKRRRIRRRNRRICTQKCELRKYVLIMRQSNLFAY